MSRGGIASLSIRRPVFAVMLVGGLVVLGAISAGRLDVGLFPEVEIPVVTVTTRLPGASPEAIEREVSQPLEEAINQIEGIETLHSASTQGLSSIVIRFDLDSDPAIKAQDVRDKVASARDELPRQVEAPVVERFDPDADPILSVLLSSPKTVRSLSELADKRVKPRLERVSGVGQVSLLGDRPREIRIWLDPLRLSGHGLAVDDVLAALERGHVELPGGRIDTPGAEYVVRTEGRLTSAHAFGDLVVAERDGRTVRLRDVAVVEDGMAEERTVARLDGERGVSLLVRKQSGENLVAVARAVKAELERVREDLPPDVQLVVAQDMSVFIESSIREVRTSLAAGACLAVLVVLAFLRSWRSTVIAALAIPSSLVASFVFFHAFGFALNNMTLIALSLSIGMLIDDAIVVLENVYRHMERGASPLRAAETGTREIGLAVVATTLALCAVFVPIAFMGGIIGRFFTEFGLVVVCAVCVSTLVALTLTPMLCSRFLSVTPKRGRVYRALERGLVGLERGYGGALRWSLGHRKSVVAIALASVAGGCGLVTQVPVDFVSTADRSEFRVWVELPLGTPLARTVAAVDRIEKAVKEHPHVRLVFTTIGGDLAESVNEAELYLKLTHRSRRDVRQERIMDDVRQRIGALGLPLADFTVEQIPWMSIQGSRNYELSYAVTGPDMDALDRSARALAARLRESPGFTDVATSYETGRPEISLELLRGRAADLGVTAEQLGRSISALLGGIEVTSFEERGERYDVRVQLEPAYRDDPAKLSLLNVRAPDGDLINLMNVARVRVSSGPVRIDRENRARVVYVRANLAGLPTGEAATRVDRFVSELALPPGTAVEARGETENMQETIDAVVFAFWLALAATYMILASQFNSFVHPFTIMLSAPLSFIGAFAALWATGHTLGMMTQIGLLMLMGLVMKNGILLVDYANQLRERGRGLFQAALEAGPVRLRPVLMTTFSTVFGMVPLAFGGGDGAEWRNSMGVIVIGGLLASMFLTLLVVPVAYTLMDDAQQGIRRGLRRWVPGRRRAAAPEPHGEPPPAEPPAVSTPAR